MRTNKLDKNSIVCNCKTVYRHEIERFVKKHPDSRFSDLVSVTGISTGCGRCRDVAEHQFNILKEREKDSTQLLIDFER
jgi:bacterioferritin-associated ferredoxin